MQNQHPNNLTSTTKGQPGNGPVNPPLKSSGGATPAFHATNKKAINKGTAICAFDLLLPSKMVLIGCILHHKPDGSHWVGLPAKPYTKADHTQGWAKLIDFADKKTRDKFGQLALEAIRRLEGA